MICRWWREQVHVRRFRYVEPIAARGRNLLATSSEICGELGENWRERIGDIIRTMLPAGSVTGAPKKMTMRIIAGAEQHRRGFYTGVCGYFDGRTLDSCVLIRFLERTGEGLVYKSGGGITVYSDPRREYEELLAKIYLPLESIIKSSTSK